MKCTMCHGEGRIANDDGGTPWSYWEELPEESKLAIRLGLVYPIDCPSCGGTGQVEHPPVATPATVAARVAEQKLRKVEL